MPETASPSPPSASPPSAHSAELDAMLDAMLDAIAAAHLRQATDAGGDRRRDVVRTALECIGWSWLGLFALLGAYRRGERRGDW